MLRRTMRFVVVFLSLAQHLIMSQFLHLNDVTLNTTQLIPPAFGMGGVVEITAGMLTGGQPQINITLMVDESKVLDLVSTDDSTQVSTILSPVEGVMKGLSGFSDVRISMEFQGEGVFLEIIGHEVSKKSLAENGDEEEEEEVEDKEEIKQRAERKPTSMILPYPKEGWKSNSHKAWNTVQILNNIFVGGRNVVIKKLRAYVLV